ncbi:MAG: ankyrin repeat domain-containing protein [Pseudomonadota bacterium]|nr:ankyrin repeat domain-containing protein [Pseudomonadota bacterium]
MLTSEQTALTQAIAALDPEQVNALLQQGLSPNFLHPELGTPLTQVCDQLFNWWEAIVHGYETDQPLEEAEKASSLQPYQTIIQALIQAGANVHLWDVEEFFGPLWDATSAACAPVVATLLDQGVNPNTLDDDGMTILSSISDLWFDVDFDLIEWSEALPEEKATLELLRARGGKTTAELHSED